MNFNVNVLPIYEETAFSLVGRIFIQIDDFIFPENDWNDLIVSVLNMWIENILSIILKQKDTVECYFMDASFFFIIDVLNDSFWKIFFIKNDECIFSAYFEPKIVSKSILLSSEKVLKACYDNDLFNDNVLSLINNIIRLRERLEYLYFI